MKFFCLPSDFKQETIDKYSEINSLYEHSKIYEIYGQMAPDTVFGSCRVSKHLPKVDRLTLEAYVKYSKDKGIEFNYVVNPSCMENDELTAEGSKRVKFFFRMLREIGVDSLTLALPSLMEIAGYAAPELKVKASTICQINSPLKVKYYDELGIKRLVLDEDIHRKFDVLRNIRKVYNGDLEIIVNSFCTIDCPFKMFDYNSFSHSHKEKDTYPYYATRCKYRHIGAESFMKLNWIRPEDLHYYHDIGINYFKLQGRTNVYTGDPAKAVIHYIEESYDGDLVKLLELFSPKRPLAIAESCIDNRALDGFWEKFVYHPESCSKLCGDCGYCRRFGEASMEGPDRTLMDIMKIMDKYMLEEFPKKLEK